LEDVDGLIRCNRHWIRLLRAGLHAWPAAAGGVLALVGLAPSTMPHDLARDLASIAADAFHRARKGHSQHPSRSCGHRPWPTGRCRRWSGSSCLAASTAATCCCATPSSGDVPPPPR